MKPHHFLLLLFTFSGSFLQAKTVTLPFLDAIKLKKIRLSKTSVEGLASDNLRLEMLSLSNDSLQIYFEPGLIFEPEKEAFQTLLLADSSGIMIYPREFATAALHGYCTESSDMGPRNVAGYRALRRAPEDLEEFAWLLYRAVGGGKQGLIWGYQNREPSLTIYLKPQREHYRKDFTDFFERNRPGTTLTFTDIAEELKPASRHVVSIAANLPFMTDEDRVLSLNVMAGDGQIVRSYFQNKRYYAGAHIIEFGFSDFYPAGAKFRAQLVNETGEVFKEMWVDENTPFEEMEVLQIRYSYSYAIKQKLENVTLAVYHENGDRLMTLKKFPVLNMAYHQLQIVFTHYFDPKTKFILELADERGKVYDKTEFDTYGKTRKLYQEWGR